MSPRHSTELDLLFDNSPGVLRNTLFILTIRVIAWVLALLSLSFGISLFLDDARTELLGLLGFEAPLFDNAQALRGIGILLIVLSFCFFTIVTLCRMIMKRNGFVLELFSWHEDLKKAKRQKAAKELQKNKSL